MQAGDQVEVINVAPLGDNKVAPALTVGEIKTIKTVIHDKGENPHFDVVLPSKLSYVRSFETKEHLPDGDKIHWCHPSRFKLVETKVPLLSVETMTAVDIESETPINIGTIQTSVPTEVLVKKSPWWKFWS